MEQLERERRVCRNSTKPLGTGTFESLVLHEQLLNGALCLFIFVGMNAMEQLERETQEEWAEIRRKQGGGESLASDNKIVGDGEHGITTEISGSVWKWNVKVGDKVDAGAVVGILEAMKLEVKVKSERAGVVDRLCYDEGESMNAGDVLLILKL